MSKMSIKELAENYGTLDLLAAYVMRTSNVSEEVAVDMVYKIDMDLERWIEELTYEDEMDGEQ